MSAKEDTAVQIVVVGDEEALGRVAETEGREPVWIRGFWRVRRGEDEETVASEGLAEVEMIAVEGGAGVC